jgi:hypothetical protein
MMWVVVRVRMAGPPRLLGVELRPLCRNDHEIRLTDGQNDDLRGGAFQIDDDEGSRRGSLLDLVDDVFLVRIRDDLEVIRHVTARRPGLERPVRIGIDYGDRRPLAQLVGKDHGRGRLSDAALWTDENDGRHWGLTISTSYLAADSMLRIG